MRYQRALEKTYLDRCDIYSMDTVKDGAISKNVKVLQYQDIPCALSQKDLKSTEQTTSQNKVDYEAKLFLPPEIEVEPGSVIEVRQYGRALLFVSAGEPFRYASHQEVMLRMKKRA